jgi:phenylalanyl-tRNA synthetase beta chain
LISDFDRYPIIYDANGVVLSLPPIINGDHSKIKLETKNVLIEVTAIDRTKANITLNTICSIFSQYCSEQWSVRPVQVEDHLINIQTPDLSSRLMMVDIDYINSSLALDLTGPEMITYLHRMMVPATQISNNKLEVQIPPTRSDIFHPCDILEDVAVAYGLNNLHIEAPKTVSLGSRQPRNQLTDLLRYDMAAAGFTEIVSFVLCGVSQNFEKLRREDDGSTVLLSNYKSESTAACRTTLLIGTLLTLQSNQAQQLPIKTFEVSDVVLIDPETDVGARNDLRICAAIADNEADFGTIHGMLDRLFVLLGVEWIVSADSPASSGFYLRESTDGAFYQGQRASVVVRKDGRDMIIGSMGVIHPEVLNNFKLKFPVSALELTLEIFV